MLLALILEQWAKVPVQFQLVKKLPLLGEHSIGLVGFIDLLETSQYF
jgi:hypothetical protein